MKKSIFAIALAISLFSAIEASAQVGIIGGLIGAAAAPWALIAGTIAAFGFGCKLEIVKKDGTTDEIV